MNHYTGAPRSPADELYTPVYFIIRKQKRPPEDLYITHVMYTHTKSIYNMEFRSMSILIVNQTEIKYANSMTNIIINSKA